MLIVPPSFLSYVDLLGTTYSASTLATGYGAHIAQPLLRKEVEGKEDTLTEEEAVRIMETCIRVLFYRDARSIDKVRPSPIFPFEIVLSSFDTSINSLPLLQTGSVSQNLAPSQRHGRSLKALEGTVPRPSEFHEILSIPFLALSLDMTNHFLHFYQCSIKLRLGFSEL